MIKNLFNKTVYVKVFENRFVLKLIESDAQPVTLMSHENFTTKRLLVGQFGIAEKLLTEGIKNLFPRRLFSASPIILIHPMEKTEEGLSDVEDRIFRELAAGAGASKVIVWVGHELSDAEVVQQANSA